MAIYFFFFYFTRSDGSFQLFSLRHDLIDVMNYAQSEINKMGSFAKGTRCLGVDAAWANCTTIRRFVTILRTAGGDVWKVQRVQQSGLSGTVMAGILWLMWHLWARYILINEFSKSRSQRHAFDSSLPDQPLVSDVGPGDWIHQACLRFYVD